MTWSVKESVAITDGWPACFGLRRLFSSVTMSLCCRSARMKCCIGMKLLRAQLTPQVARRRGDPVPPFERLDQAVVGATVQLQVLPRNEARLRTTQVGAGIAELLRSTESLSGDRTGDLPAGFLPRNRLLLHHATGHEFLTRRIDALWQQVIYGDIVGCGNARNRLARCRQRGTSRSRQAHQWVRRLHHGRGDIDDAPKFSGAHA